MSINYMSLLKSTNQLSRSSIELADFAWSGQFADSGEDERNVLALQDKVREISGQIEELMVAAGISQTENNVTQLRKQKKDYTDSHFGGCPTCWDYEQMLNVGRSHYAACHTHKVFWCVGANLFSSWRRESEETWEENVKVLNAYKEVEPAFSEDCEGRKAFYDDVPESQCPYAEGTKARQKWLEGWRESKSYAPEFKQRSSEVEEIEDDFPF